VKIAPAVAKAAMESGVATRPITDWTPIASSSTSSSITRACDEADLSAAKKAPGASCSPRARTSACCARAGRGRRRPGPPILIGRPAVIAQRIERFGLRLRPGTDYESGQSEHDHRYRDLLADLSPLTERAASRSNTPRSRCAGASR
jgi:malate dehydrogenase (oxaloacetate-decarboxylating)(NADP+)